MSELDEGESTHVWITNLDRVPEVLRAFAAQMSALAGQAETAYTANTALRDSIKNVAAEFHRCANDAQGLRALAERARPRPGERARNPRGSARREASADSGMARGDM